MICIVCTKNALRKKYTKDDYTFLVCLNCNFLRVEILPSLEDLSVFYHNRSKVGNYVHEKNKELYKVDQWLASVVSSYHVNEKKVFDIGCYNGQLLDILKLDEWQTWGLEFQESAALRAKLNHGEKIFVGSIEGFEPENLKEEFEVVTAMGLIEHTLNPLLLVEKIGALLKKDGYVFIQTPNYSSFVARVLGKFWPPIAPPEHLFYFSPQNLNIIFSQL